MNGKIKRFGPLYGFVIPDDGSGDVFLHISNVAAGMVPHLSSGQSISFELRTNAKGRREAVNVVLAADSGLSSEEEEVAPEAAPDDAQETEDSSARSKWGKVKFFKDGHGFLAPREGGADIFVHFSNIAGVGFKTLFRYEDVLFDLGEDEKGRPCAINVRPAPVKVWNGRVLEFDEQQGLIQPNEGASPISFFADGVLDRDPWDYDENELVKYRIVESDSGQRAVRIARLDKRKPFERFTDLGKLDWLIEQLAKKSAREPWNYRVRPTQYPFPILDNYLFHTFKRLEQEGKILYAKDRHGKPVACFNTGLATPSQEELYAFFTENRHPPRSIASKTVLDAPPWTIAGCYTSTDGPMLNFSRTPDLATYFEGDSFKSLVFDHTLDFRIDRKHILEDRLDRFLEVPDLPEFLKQDADQLGSKFDTAIELAKRRVRRNYKTAIPTFNRGKINLLLPLCIVKKDTADLALLLERRADYEGKSDFYVGWTVLTLDMAYNNARLLARPDTEWLMP